MKVYLHFEEPPEFTKVVSATSSTCTIRDLLVQFVDAYNAKHAAQRVLSIDQLSVRTEKKKTLPLDAAVEGFLEDRADAYVVVASHASATPPVPSAAGSAPPASVLQVQRPPPPPTAAPVVREEQQPAAGATLQGQCLPLIKALTEQASELIKNKNQRGALGLYQQILALVPDHVPTLLAVAELWISAGRASQGLECARRAVGLSPADDTVALEILAQCLSESGQGAEALKKFEEAVAITKKKGGGSGSAHDLALQLAIARCLYALPDAGYRDAAASLVMMILKQDDAHWDALYEYARIASDRGLTEDCLRVALRLLVQRSTHAGVRAMLARALEAPGGLELLREELSGGPGASGSSPQAALAFLATCVKDHGAVGPAITLYKQAVQAAPLNSSYVLNLFHTMELTHSVTEALNVAADFLENTPLTLGGGLDLQDVVSELRGLPPLDHMTSLTWLNFKPWNPPPSLKERQRVAGAPLLRAVDASPTTSAQAGDTAAASTSAAAPGGSKSHSFPKVEYTSDQLDVLALLFTCVKVLYLGGAIASADRLCDLINPARTAAKQELHTTLVRNEAAYFGCVMQLVKDHPPPPPPPPPGLPILYLCGDSHCLSGAWHQVSLRGAAHLLLPLLVTGCKIWHLRPASNFYPKIQFMNTMDKLPQGAKVIFMFGEIDCREGLYLAVQKCKYDTLEEGMDVAISVYVELLQRLIQQRGFEVWVHPIAPVLNETRPVVRTFNDRMRSAMMKAARSGESQGRLHYLDFFDQLLTDDGAAFHPDLAFDGTHMAPAYLTHLQAQLDALQ